MARRKAGTVSSTALTAIRFELDSAGRPTFRGTRFEFTAQVLDDHGRAQPMVSERMPDTTTEMLFAVAAFNGLTEVEAGNMGVKFDAPPEQPQA